MEGHGVLHKLYQSPKLSFQPLILRDKQYESLLLGTEWVAYGILSQVQEVKTPDLRGLQKTS